MTNRGPKADCSKQPNAIAKIMKRSKATTT